MPRSWPPPSKSGSRRTRGSRRRTYRAPTPLGPYILCADRLSRSMPIASTSSGTLPAACTASVWNRTPRSLHSRPIARDRLQRADLVVGRHDADQNGLLGHGRGHLLRRHPAVAVHRQERSTRSPRASRRLHGSRTARCSTAVVTICRPLVAVGGSHALEGQVVALGGAAGEDDFLRAGADRVATCSRARSTASSACPAEGVGAGWRRCRSAR